MAFIDDSLAQLVEQLPFKEWALGSNPRRVTTWVDYDCLDLDDPFI
jgi:hypothetical protein